MYSGDRSVWSMVKANRLLASWYANTSRVYSARLSIRYNRSQEKGLTHIQKYVIPNLNLDL